MRSASGTGTPQRTAKQVHPQTKPGMSALAAPSLCANDRWRRWNCKQNLTRLVDAQARIAPVSQFLGVPNHYGSNSPGDNPEPAS